jgi:hypothetical protein
MKPLLLLPSLLLLAACGPRYGMRVPDEMVKKLPYETRIELLEAENDLAVAIDKADQASSEIGRARDNIRRARSRAKAAEQELDRAEDAISKEVAKLTIEEAESRVEYLRARQHLNVSLLEVEQLALRCAFARFELARVSAARKAKVAGSEELDPKNFEAQVAECDASVKEERASLGGNTTDEKTAREAWEAKKAALAKKTFDARTSPYVENL